MEQYSVFYIKQYSAAVALVSHLSIIYWSSTVCSTMEQYSTAMDLVSH